MIVKIDKSFSKDTSKIKDKSFLNKVANCIEEMQRSDNLDGIKGLKKLQSFKNIYRIRIGDYRLGIYVEDNTVEFVRCLHRKDIYKFFPK